MHENQPVGFLMLKQHSDRAAEIYVMAVCPSSRKLGIGRRLVAVAERMLCDCGVEYL